jgi:flagellin
MRRADRGLAAAMQRLSTGYRINSARDDAAGLAIANKLSFQIGGLTRASENATHGISLVQTAEGALNEIHGMIQRMRELAVQAANDTNTAADRELLQREVTQLTDEIHAIANRTEYNRMRILNGEADRVTENIWHSPAGDITARGIATLLYMSEQVPPGSLPVNIQEVGRPAILSFWPPADWTAQKNGTFYVNDNPVYVKEGDNLQHLLNGALEYAGVEAHRHPTNSSMHLVTKIAGRDQHISFRGDTELLAAMGIGNGTYTPGSDAVLGGSRIILEPPLPATEAELMLNDMTGVTTFSEDGNLLITVNGSTHDIPIVAGVTMWDDVMDHINDNIDGIRIMVDNTDPANPIFTIVSYDDTNDEILTGVNQSITFFAATPKWEPNDLELLANFICDITLTNTATGNASTDTPASLALLPLNDGKVFNFDGALVLTVNGGIPFEVQVRNGVTTWANIKNDLAMQGADVSFIGNNIVTNFPASPLLPPGTDPSLSLTVNKLVYTPHSDLMDYFFPSDSPNPVTVSGKDEISSRLIPLQLFDINGRPVPGTNLAASINGNQVHIRGTGGEDIRFNIQVRVDPSNPPALIFGNVAPSTAIGAVLNPMDLTFNFREYGPLRLQIGPSHNNAIDVQIPRLNAETLGLVEYVAGERRSLLLYTTTEGATNAIGVMDKALMTVSTARSRLGAFQNRLESTVRSLDVAAENTETSRSRIKDTDMARDSTRFAQYNVMFQAAQAMLGQANQRPQQLLALLQ